MATQADAYDDAIADDKADPGKRQHEREVARKKIRAEIKKLDTEIFMYTKKIESIQAAVDAETKVLNTLKQFVISYNNSHPTPRSPEEAAEFAAKVTNVNNQQKKLDFAIAGLAKTKKLKKEAEEKRKQLNNKLRLPSGHGSSAPKVTVPTDKNDATIVTPTPPTNDGTQTVADSVKMTEVWKYNAPMVKEAYFSYSGIQDKLQYGTTMDRFKFEDAKNAWKGVIGGVGTIQMNKEFAQMMAPTKIAESDRAKAAAKAKDKTYRKFDNQLYGFRFLYNPTSVGLAWGQQSQTVPSFEASGADKSFPISVGLIASTISFSLMLNRIEDFNQIDENGKYTSPGDKKITDTLNNPNPMNKVLGAYPTPVSEAERKIIYERGTMYDLEYLFRTIMGPNGNFQSGMNGFTADRGWIRPTVVELHLGAGMRYRVQIQELSVNHAVFNSRMVPILSTVNITARRFNDFPKPK